MTITVSTGLAAAVSGTGNKITYLEAMIAALGVSRTMTAKRSATAGDVWNIGTTFYAATCGGTMTVAAGALTGLGVVTAIATRLAADLATGYSVLRIEGNGHWLQGTLGLTGSGADFLLARSPSGLYSIMPAPNCKVKAPIDLPSAPDVVLTTFTLHNKSGSTQAADFVAPLFGHAFKKGEVPVGTHPYFRTATGGVTCPATLFNVALWPDGSMRFAAVLLRVPASIAGNGSLSIQVRSGGQAPATGTRTLSEVSALGMAIEMNITTPAEGVFTSDLANAITNDNDVVLYANGPAGAVWRIGGYAKNGGTAHSQLYAHHYVLALTNANGSLRGFRYLGRVLQPWVSAGTLPSRSRELTCTVKAGATTLRNMLGHLSNETPTATFGLPHYASFTTADADARYDYVQGAGNTAADCTIHVEHNIAYAVAAQWLAPYGGVGSTESPAVDYRPQGAGSMLRYMPQTGGRPDIGLFTGWDVNYMANPSANNQRSIRVQVMCSSGWRNALWKRDTRRPVAVSDIRASYAGLGSIETTWRNHSSGGGFVQASPNNTLWSEDVAHRPQPFLLSYLVTGEPHILDIAIDDGVAMQASTPPGLQTITTTRPNQNPAVTPWTGSRDLRVGTDDPETVKGASLAFAHGRIGAWMSRQLYAAAAMCPAVMPDGCEVNLYLDDVARAGHRAWRRYAERMPDPHRSDGLYVFSENGGTDVAYESPWQIAFWNMVLCWASGIWDTEDLNLARKYFARKYVRANELFRAETLTSYRFAHFDHNENLVTSMNQYLGDIGKPLTLDEATNTITLAEGAFGWNITDGDLVGFSTHFSRGDDIGRTYAVRVYWTDTNGVEQMVESATVGPIINPNAVGSTLVTLTGNEGANGLPAISGILTEGKTLSVNTSKITGTNGTLRYKWYRDGQEVTGNTAQGSGDAGAGTRVLGWSNFPFPSLGRGRRLYVVNSTATTFQVSLTPGGAPLDILRSTTVHLWLLQPQNTTLAFWPAPGSDYPISAVGALNYHKYRGDTEVIPVLDYLKPKAVAWGFNPDTARHQHNFASE